MVFRRFMTDTLEECHGEVSCLSLTICSSLCITLALAQFDEVREIIARYDTLSQTREVDHSLCLSLSLSLSLCLSLSLSLSLSGSAGERADEPGGCGAGEDSSHEAK